MSRDSTEARAPEIQQRIEAWVRHAVAGTEAAGGVDAAATATRSVSLPGAPGETVPEEWSVTVRLRFSDGDEGAARRQLDALSGATATVTLESREAAEITCPDTTDVQVVADGDALVADVTVGFQIPWPHENDAAVPAA